MKRIITVTIAALALIVIGLIVLIKIYVTPESIKKFLVPYAEQTLNRKIGIGEVKISLLKGIDVKDFTVKEKDGQTDFVTCKDFILKFQLLPLLSKKVVIDELKLLGPEVKIRRNNEGEFNFKGIGEKEKTQEAKKEETGAETKGLPVSLLVKNISVRDARFSLVDSTKKLPDIKGSLAVDSTIKGADGSSLNSEGKITLKLDEVLLPQKQMKDINASLDYAVHIDLESNNMQIDRADLKFQGILASITGNVRSFKKEPDINIAVQIAKLNMADAQKGLSPFADFRDLSLSGSLSADVRLKGKPEKIDTLNADGKVSLGKTGIQFKNMHAVVEGGLGLSGQSVSIDMQGTVGKNTLDIRGSVSNLFKTPDIVLNLYSKHLVLDELVPAPSSQGAATSEASPPASTEKLKEAEPLDLKLSAAGEIRVDSAAYKNMSMSDFFVRYQFKDNKLDIDKMTAVAGKGRLNVFSRIDLSKPGYIYNLTGNLDSLHADEVVNSLFPKAKDTVFGVLSSNLRLNGAGTLSESIRKNLAGEGDFNMKDGKITNARIAENLAVFLNIDELKTINLKQARGLIKIKNGVAHLESIFTSDDIAMDPSGDIGLDESLNLAFDLKLSPRLSKKTVGSGAAKYIKDQEGWGMIPLKVAGTLSQPAYSVDVAKAGKRVIEKELEKVMDKLFKKEEGGKEPQGETQENKKPAEELLKRIFK